MYVGCYLQCGSVVFKFCVKFHKSICDALVIKLHENGAVDLLFIQFANAKIVFYFMFWYFNASCTEKLKNEIDAES